MGKNNSSSKKRCIKKKNDKEGCNKACNKSDIVEKTEIEHKQKSEEKVDQMSESFKDVKNDRNDKVGENIKKIKDDITDGGMVIKNLQEIPLSNKELAEKLLEGESKMPLSSKKESHVPLD